MTQFESEFLERLEGHRQNSAACAVFTYTQFAFDHLVGSDPDLLDRANDHPAFWTGIMGAMQTASIVALGRMYDDDRNTHSAAQLLAYADDHLGLFSRAALEVRKVAVGLNATDAKQYAATAFELRRGGLVTIRQAFTAKQQFYRNSVQPIRHNVFAHAGRLTKAERDALFTGLFKRDLEELVVFGLRLYEALFQLYHNGREPVLPDAPANIAQVLQSLPADNTNTWEHLHVAKSVSKFIDWLKATPQED